VHSYPLPFRLWSKYYRTGQALEVVDVRQVSAQNWPLEIKCRSRMHYYRAGQQARRSNPEATALLLDERGHVSETPIANIVLYFAAEGFVSPRPPSILPGISLAFLQQLADQRQIPFLHRDIKVDELLKADEILLTSTPYCILPVTRVNGHQVGQGSPGKLFSRLIGDWSERVGCDILAQAVKYAERT
jgi:branched-subunit amino acid aminotransferase/4-amino-4-deoxychorismate lyase